MKFKFCGDIEPPEWIFAAVSHLSRLSAVRIRLIAGQIAKLIKEGIFEKEKMWKMCRESGLKASETESTLSAIHFLLVTACKFAATPEMLTDEIGQLGLPLEHAQMITKAYKIDSEEMRAALINQHLRLNGVQKIRWRTDYELRRDSVDVKVQIDQRKGGTVGVAMTSEMLGVLINELNKAKTVINNLS